MATLTPDLAEILRETNSKLQTYFDILVQQETPVQRPASPQLIAELLSELRRTGERLRSLPARRDAQLEEVLAEYRRKVERLRDVLPSIHAVLLAERARLECERARLDSAAEWVRRSRQTL
jgi:hypothetical protein